jgi:hypothetical protein
MTAPDSPLAGLRATFAARQEAAPDRYVDIWDGGHLIAKLDRTTDPAWARAAMRTMAMLVDDAEAMRVTEEDLADVIAMATAGLYVREGDGAPVALGQPGAPLRFDSAFGQAVGLPEITTPRDAVYAAFSSPTVEGGPAELDVLKLMLVATTVAFTIADMAEQASATAEAVVGEASAPRS